MVVSNFEEIKQLVVNEFSGKNAQERYVNNTRAGLWNAEKIMFQKYYKKNSSILDIGCGSGRTSFALNKMGYKVIGRDLTPAMIQSAKKLTKEFKIKIDFKVGDATKLEFKDENFDNALFSFNGWDQIPGRKNRLKALKEICRVIKPGGYFIFTSHIRNLWGKYFWFWLGQWAKLYLLKPIGFKIDEQEWGDRFFKRESSNLRYTSKQYTCIPSLKEIIQDINKTDFELVFNEYKNTILYEDIYTGNCMFFICRKK